MQNIQEKLQYLRGNREQKEIAKLLNIKDSTMSSYELGTRTPPDEIKLRIASFYGVSVEWLFFSHINHKM
ncbi:helix-turn-helix transcriptional regulator [Cytobacillus sp. Hm23]